MKTTLIALSACIVLLCVNTGGNAQEVIYDSYKISKPYTHKNLTLWFLQGGDQLIYDNMLTLEEALEKDIIKVLETSNVGELAIENKSEHPVFIQSGDIVKGGKQDRVIRYDIIIPPWSDRIPLASFCVEYGRWSQRGNESYSEFSGSSKRIASRDLKLATIDKESQQDVWGEVEELQAKLNSNMDAAVENSESESSLQLTLENEELDKLTEDYTAFFGDLFNNSDDIIGFVFAINGEINSADFYGSAQLFRKTWPRLIEATSVEAIAEYNKGLQYETQSANEIKDWLIEVETGKQYEKLASGNTEIIIKESGGNFVFETYDKEQKGKWLHKSVIRK